MINVLIVMFGDAYPESYFDWIRENFERGVERHELAFHALTDRDTVPAPWRNIPFERDFNSKLKKLEMFRPDICPGQRVVYSDLDNTIVGNIDHMLDYTGKMAIRREFPGMRGVSDVQSSFILFEGGANAYLYDEARANPNLAEEFPIGGGRGDQLFIGKHKREWDALDDLFPGACVSYKWNVRNGRFDRAATRVVFHHGKGDVKPHNLGWDIQI